MSGHRPRVWSDEEYATVLEMWNSGMSAAQIGRKLKLSRNVVIGRLNRRGPVPAHTPIYSPRPTPRAKPEPLPMPEAPTCEAVRTIDLAPHHCKWPLNMGDPEYLHCGASRVPGQPYCAFHVAKAFNRGGRGEKDAA